MKVTSAKRPVNRRKRNDFTGWKKPNNDSIDAEFVGPVIMSEVIGL